MIEISKLNQMLSLEVAAGDWFSKLNRKEQEAYKKAHPRSKYAKSGGSSSSKSRSPVKPAPVATLKVPKHLHEALTGAGFAHRGMSKLGRHIYEHNTSGNWGE